MNDEKQVCQVFILRNKSGQWSWELHIDGELYQAGAGYDTEGDAIEGAHETLQDSGHDFNVVLTPDAGTPQTEPGQHG